jgi:hypothetical protein
MEEEYATSTLTMDLLVLQERQEERYVVPLLCCYEPRHELLNSAEFSGEASSAGLKDEGAYLLLSRWRS